MNDSRHNTARPPQTLPEVDVDARDRDLIIKGTRNQLKAYTLSQKGLDLCALNHDGRQQLVGQIKSSLDNASMNSYLQKGQEPLETFLVESFLPFYETLDMRFENAPDAKSARGIGEIKTSMKKALGNAVKNDGNFARQICEKEGRDGAYDFINTRNFKPVGLDEPTHSPYPDAYEFSYEGQAYVIDPRLDEVFVTREAFLEKYPPGKDWS